MCDLVVKKESDGGSAPGLYPWMTMYHMAPDHKTKLHSFRLENDTSTRLERYARQRGYGRSEAIREAINNMLDSHPEAMA